MIVNIINCRTRHVLYFISYAKRCFSTNKWFSLYGQPIYTTHPHLVKPAELTPGITVAEYAARRSQLAAALPAHSLTILIGAQIMYKTASTFYVFHQYPNFFYLTDIHFFDLSIVERDNSSDGFKSYLFLRNKDPEEERWEGPRTGIEEAKDIFHIDEVYDLQEAQDILGKSIRRIRQIYADIPFNANISSIHPKSKASDILDSLCKCLLSHPILPITPWIHQLREIKSEAELNLMEQAASRSAAAFNSTMQTPSETEGLLWAKLSYEFKKRDCDEAYVPVIAGGTNALIIHYTMNNMQLRNGDLVLVDAGGEYGNYVTDITRTWPVNGVFSPQQRDLYQAVLNVQKACIQLCSERHALSLDMIHQHSVELLKTELKQLGFNISYSDLYNILYPHYIGHHIGLDIHDCSKLPGRRLLKNNQTIAIEPGLYIPDLPRFPKHFRGLGVRIEDSIRVGKENPTVLSKDAVKEIVDIEKICDKYKQKND
ncbi:hypothetical protein T552_03365 [Pneumocystis carinii B80]|uniref:Aminopeptidase P N-terminal domain-containing protein n=1 Tax=Pneumocystis carinii (strain B80) TaxID=1408658 RepID=A0A0W4ZBD6_PNEC8|nr:hypothetical protein T552_03365 [Pneumocystis carinii B80]KTW25752.1 hypothetical protein T552_03365 [Pneumocystis carinii B80]